MRLTKFTDYSLRVLILAASERERNVTITQAADLFGISAPHLKKVVRTLSKAGFIVGTRGRSGGFSLARPPEEINLGAVIRTTEPDFAMVECFRSDGICSISPICKLPNLIDQALAAMMNVFDGLTLADIALSHGKQGRLGFLQNLDPKG